MGIAPWQRDDASQLKIHEWLDTTGPYTNPTKTSRFYSMWGLPYQRRQPKQEGCWDWQGGAGFFSYALKGDGCWRDWLGGTGACCLNGPALFGFDESINEVCSRSIGQDPWDGTDLNMAIAYRCPDANRNVLRLLDGGWSMCQNLEWQLCALQGLLPDQGSKQIAFATAPKDLKLRWWEDPGSHPTYPCSGNYCDPNGFSVGDVYFAEIATAYAICSNREEMFALKAGELWTCDLDKKAYAEFVKRMRAW